MAEVPLLDPATFLVQALMIVSSLLLPANFCTACVSSLTTKQVLSPLRLALIFDTSMGDSRLDPSVS